MFEKISKFVIYEQEGSIMGRFKSKSIETLCVQAGYEAKNGEPRITPLVQSTTYQYDSADEVADLFDLTSCVRTYE